MNNPFTEKFASDTAKEFGMEPRPLITALSRAWELYEDQSRLTPYREPFTAEIKRLMPVLKALQQAKKKWAKLSPETRDRVAEFIGTGVDRFVDERLDDLIALLEEYKEHYSNPRGKPGKADSNPLLEMAPLELATEVLAEHWFKTTGRPLGHELKQETETTSERKPEDYNLSGQSAGIIFIHACLEKMVPWITWEVCRTLIRKLPQHSAVEH